MRDAYADMRKAHYDISNAQYQLVASDVGGSLACITFAIASLESAKSKLMK